MRLGLGTDISIGYRQPLFGGVPLLDTYTGAAAAYSLRELRTGVTNVVRVREDSGNTEQDFTAKEITDGTLLAFVGAGNNGHVVTWYDQSGNGNDATQATAASQPKIVDSGVLVEENGKPAVQFDGTDDALATSDYIVELSQNNATAFAVRSITSISNGGYMLTEADVVSTYSSNFIFGGDDGSEVLWVNTSEFGTISSAQQDLLAFTYNGTNFQAYLNGAVSGSAGTASVNLEVLNRTVIGASAVFTFNYEGKIQEIITYKSDQSDNRTAIEENINDHYNIYP